MPPQIYPLHARLVIAAGRFFDPYYAVFPEVHLPGPFQGQAGPTRHRLDLDRLTVEQAELLEEQLTEHRATMERLRRRLARRASQRR